MSELDNIDKHRTLLVVDDPRLMTKRRLVGGGTEVIKEKLVGSGGPVSSPLPAPRPAGEVEMEETDLTVVLSETGLAWDKVVKHLPKAQSPEVKA